MSYMNSESMLVKWPVRAAVPLFLMHVIASGMGMYAMVRTSDTVHDWSNPANGHLTDHMNAVYRNAISVNPFHTMATQLGVSLGCIIFSPFTAFLFEYSSEKGSFNAGILIAGFIQLLLTFANFVPGALGWISLKNWGCANITYGKDRSNATENQKSRDACNDYKGASTLMLMVAGIYVLCFTSLVAFVVRGSARKTARSGRSTSNV